MSQRQVIHTPEEIIRIRAAAEITAKARDEVAAAVRAGMSTYELDQIAGSIIRSTGGTAAFLGYGGFPGNCCISLNDTVVHGIGSPEQIIQNGDIVSIDIGVEINGALGDTCRTVFVGDKMPDNVKRLLEGTEASLMAGISAAVAGNYIGDISRNVEHTAHKYHLSVVREYVGHGCGIKLHEPPEVPNFSGWGRGVRLVPGMVICIEPMLNLGTANVTTSRTDGWTVRTNDGAWSAHFEHMVLITETKPEILTWRKTM